MRQAETGRPPTDRLPGPLLAAPVLAAEIAEPLLESAPIAFAMAMEHCTQGGTCQAYHAVWQYLRLADIAGSVRVDGSLHVAAVERLARTERLRRVLISGSADYSMLAHIAHAAHKAGAEPAFELVDLCPAALRVNEWYAARKGLRLRTIAADVLLHRGAEPYDLICAHSFIHWLAPADRPRLLQAWSDQLAPQGRVLASNRVWSERYTLAPEEMERRVVRTAEKTLAKLAEQGIPLPCERGRFHELLCRFGHRRGDQLPPLPLPDLERWIEAAGLAIEVAVRGEDVVPDMRDSTMGPFSTDRGPRMWFQLRRA